MGEKYPDNHLVWVQIIEVIRLTTRLSFLGKASIAHGKGFAYTANATPQIGAGRKTFVVCHLSSTPQNFCRVLFCPMAKSTTWQNFNRKNLTQTAKKLF
jgi:hypothetical protein